MSRGSESVLVVEDEADVRDIAVAFLRSAGYDVLAAADADSALALLKDNPGIALLFSDVVLGTGMNGVELAEQARQLHPDLPVLLTSGYEHSALPPDSRASEQFTLLQKPYRREELSSAVRAKLDRR